LINLRLTKDVELKLKNVFNNFSEKFKLSLSGKEAGVINSLQKKQT
jgi:hypothetical protein